jgi:hypothetical protein
MAPRLVESELRKFETRGGKDGGSYLEIDLKNENGLDIGRFDELVKEIRGFQEGRTGIINLKYIVARDRLCMFREEVEHIDFFMKLSREGMVGDDDLQSGGQVMVWIMKNNEVKREIYGLSGTLKYYAGLSVEDSEKYKKEVMESRLDEWFSFSYYA